MVLGESKPPYLPFDVISIIADVGSHAYRALLNIPRFGRSSLTYKHQLRYQSNFTFCTIDRYSGGESVYRWCLKCMYGYSIRYHRLDGPAVICYNPDGSKNYEEWYFNGLRHRSVQPGVIMGPSYIEYCDNVEIFKIWYYRHLCHRIDGPAIIRSDGSEVWYLDGNSMTREEHEKKMTAIYAQLGLKKDE
jgi:hypothetical protein